MTAPATLGQFLLARIAEDEAHAQAADDWYRRTGAYDIGYAASDPGVAHALRFNPSRILAECGAKRRIVLDLLWLAGDVLRQLALPYADHPDYREEWRP